MTTTELRPSPLDGAPDFSRQPFYTETLALLRSVRDHDFDRLAALCDDDFGIVDIDPTGAARTIRTRDEWEAWFRDLFATLTAMSAHTDSEILDYKALEGVDLGMSALEFRQTLTIGDLTASFDCIATLVWKLTDNGWREARWHCSVIESDVPDELLAAAAEASS